LVADICEQETLAGAAGLAERGRQALLGEHPGEHFVGYHLRVNEHAVAFEDHEIVHGGRALYSLPKESLNASDGGPAVARA
jgi:hypothetical protein